MVCVVGVKNVKVYIINREIRKKAWKWAWPKFRDLKVKEVIG
jgi:hypothetical protein